MNRPEAVPGQTNSPFHLDLRPGPAYLKLEVPAGFAAGFSLRSGGCSRGAFAEANMSYAVGDEPRRVTANRAALLNKAGSGGRDFNRLVTVRQVHGSRCLVVDDDFPPLDRFPERLEADALVTARPGILLAVQTADCLPLIMIAAAPRAVAVVHAGWRGLEKGIATVTVARLKSVFGVTAESLKVYAGPAVGPCCYEVGGEVVEAFRKKPWLAAAGDWVRHGPDGIFLDLVAIQRRELLAAGVRRENFLAANLCTCCRDLCFSYRRDRAITGRQLAFAGIRRENQGDARI